jgi:hypothetical protein
VNALLTTFCFAALNAHAAPPEADRAAILSMVGTFEVTFQFTEDAALAPDYKIVSEPYEEHAMEVVLVAEDTAERIILQHLLLVINPKKKADMVIKHWAQVWTWQDTKMLSYSGQDGIDEWSCVSLSAHEAAGKWTQLVTSIDDTPRYEGSGKWQHKLGVSTWKGTDTARPLPRREYSKRHDYDQILGSNTHTVGVNGWLHFQDNFKVITRDGTPTALAHETGLNQYVRTESPRAEIAVSWWKENQGTWDGIREFWLNAGESAEDTFSYTTSHDGIGLSSALGELEKRKPSTEEISNALGPFLLINK